MELRRENVQPHLSECAAESARVAAGVGQDRLGEPSGCGDWDVRTLVNHWVLYGSHGLEHRALRKALPDELTARDFTTDPEWAAAFATQLDRAVAAWAEPAAWEGEIDLGFAQQAAPEVAALLLLELALHGWDVAHATGQDFKVSDAAGAVILDVVTANAEMYRQYEGFGAAVELPDGASDFTRALALSGRDPR
ncbi:TIGR03086 family metal-binding protein [Streptomyces sp. NPDC050145]|uniref:TIGR03086 family metal-binding protein n=1 Tax=Streptomyces sp. NPDC050145 TaxID=3365602 RepID=UPI0037AA1EEC